MNKNDIKKDMDDVEPIKGADLSVDDFELDDSVVSEASSNEVIKKLREKLKNIEAEKQEYLTGWQTAKADLINARKRDEAERKEFIKYSNERLVEELIPVMNSFDMAMGNKEAWEKAEKNWRTGVEYIYSQLLKVLVDFGVKEENPIDVKFDHSLHEAVSYEPTNDKKLDNMIIQVLNKGFSLNGKVLRAPKVKVGEYKE